MREREGEYERERVSMREGVCVLGEIKRRFIPFTLPSMCDSLFTQLYHKPLKIHTVMDIKQGFSM